MREKYFFFAKNLNYYPLRGYGGEGEGEGEGGEGEGGEGKEERDGTGGTFRQWRQFLAPSLGPILKLAKEAHEITVLTSAVILHFKK
jgi:hypothetical protein